MSYTNRSGIVGSPRRSDKPPFGPDRIVDALVIRNSIKTPQRAAGFSPRGPTDEKTAPSSEPRPGPLSDGHSPVYVQASMKLSR